jgi:hypothetical protein
MPPSEGSAANDPRVRADVAAFLSSPHAQPFLADREGTGAVARAFLEVCYGELALRPDLLEEEQLREALLELLPPRIDPNERAAANAPAIVRALLEQHGETHPNANSWKLATVLDDAERAFPKRLRERGGSALAPDPTPITRPGSKLGRNDPCPCGSGRKWKKCCGKAA